MDNITESHAVISKVAFGDATKFHDRTRPTLEADGRIHLDSEDGRILASVDVRSMVQRVSTLENTGDLVEMARSFAPETYFRLFHFRLVVTEARLIWEQEKPAGPGVKMVGHLRFPWISTVSFRPKQSFLREAQLSLEFDQDFPVAALGGWFHTVELGFDKRFSPGSLAHLVVQQVARHHLQHGAPDDVTRALEALATVAPVPDPPNGKEARYVIPVHATYPGCVDYIGDGIVGGEWHVDSSAVKIPTGREDTSPC